MADIGIPMQAIWDRWCASRGPRVAAAGKKLVPWKLYRDKGSGLRCTLVGFHEDHSDPSAPVTAIADFTGVYNLISFERRVHSLPLDDLEECDLPAEGEKLGVIMSNEQRLAFINEGRKENGLAPLTEEELRQLSANSTTCVIDGGGEHVEGEGEGEGKEEVRQEESSGQGQAPTETSTEAVPAQEAGTSDDKTTDGT